MKEYQAVYNEWVEKVTDAELKKELLGLDEAAKMERFGSLMTFGTAGLRAKMGPGSAFMNVYTVAHATAGFAEFIKKQKGAKEKSVAIAYDSRNNSALFAKRASEVLTANGIKVYLFDDLRPTPELSFAVLNLKCSAGIVITASHNTKEYNGYKAYGADGIQLSEDDAKAVSAEMEKIDIFDVPSSDKARPELEQTIGKELDEKYLESILAERVKPDVDKKDLKVVYTPLHGAGSYLVPEIFKRSGVKFFCVEKQKKPDGNFPTVEKPNPEDDKAYELGIKLAEEKKADLVIATDPDSDRVGCCARTKPSKNYPNGRFIKITGNQMGALLLNYLIETHTKDELKNTYAVKSVVSSDMAIEIAKETGIQFIEVLTGFKYIGKKIEKYLKKKKHLLSYEESYGMLCGEYTREKDAVLIAMLIAEMAAYYKAQGKTLIDVLRGLFKDYKYFGENVIGIEVDGIDDNDKKARMAKKIKKLRDHAPKKLGGEKVVEVRDYLNDTFKSSDGEELPESDMLCYVNANGDKFIVRPSGTEPKIKIYILASAKQKKDLDAHMKLLNAEVGKLFADIIPKKTGRKKA